MTREGAFESCYRSQPFSELVRLGVALAELVGKLLRSGRNGIAAAPTIAPEAAG